MGKSWTVHWSGVHLHRGRVSRYLPKGKSTFYLIMPDREFELTATFKKGMCVVAVWRPNERLSRPTAPRLRWEMPSMAIKRREVTTTDVQHLAAMETTLMSQHMALIEHCALRKYEDGSDREPGWFTIKVTGAAWVVQVKDPDSRKSFSAVADTFDKAIDTANLLLACDDAPWERDVWLEKMMAEKKKK